ncbi:MAG TPA: trigger factor, partial [Chroococcales cyanobacterium]
MKVTLEKKEKNQVEIEVEVDQQQINAALNRVYRQISQRVNIPGFRKGKAPRQLIERHVGADYVKNEALEVLIPEAYSSAIEEANIEPIAQPEVEVVRFSTDDSLVFKAKIEVRPEVVLGNYLGLEIQAPQKKEIGEADVEKEIDSLRSRFATTQAVEPRPVRENDVVLLDFKGSSEGKEIENGSATDFKLEVLPGRFIPGFVESLIGMTPGETKMVELSFPENYPQKELAGKPATFE